MPISQSISLAFLHLPAGERSGAAARQSVDQDTCATPTRALRAKKTRSAVVIFGFGSTWPPANGGN